MKITINIEKEEPKPVEYELDCYGQRSKTEYSEDEVIINIHEKEEDKPKTKYENKKGIYAEADGRAYWTGDETQILGYFG